MTWRPLPADLAAAEHAVTTGAEAAVAELKRVGAPAAPESMLPSERMRVRAAATAARARYPGPVGEVLYKELLDWDAFGYRFGAGGGQLIHRLVQFLTAPETPAAAGG